MKAQSLISKNKLLLMLLFFFFLRIIYSYCFGCDEITHGDTKSYNAFALAILNNSDWLTNPDFYGHYRAPVYPMFLAINYLIFGIENFFAVYCIQAIFSTLTVYYIFKLSSSIFDERISFLAFIWAGFYFFYFWFTGMLLRETLIFFLIIFSFYQLWYFLNKEECTEFIKSRHLWQFIIAFTILLHTDARYLFYLPFISVLFLIYKKKYWVGIKQYLWLLGIIIILLIPWSIRNFIAYDRFVLINTRTLQIGKKEISFRYLNVLKPRKSIQTDNKNYPSEEERILIKEGENPNDRSSEEIDIIKKDIYPASTFFDRKIYRFKEMWIPFRFWSDYEPFPKATFRRPWSLKHNLISIIFYGALIPFMFYSFLSLIKRRNKAVWILSFPIVVHAMLHFMMWGRDRYRMHIDSFIIVLGCYGMILTYDLLRKRMARNSVQTTFS